MLGGLDVFLDALELAEFSLDDEALGVGGVDDALGDLDVLLVGEGRGVDHDGRIDAGVDAVHAGLFVAVVQMDREDGFGEDLVGRLHHGLEHLLVGVLAGALGELDYERGLGADVALEETHRLLEVVDVVCADGVFAVGEFEKFPGGDDHLMLLR